MNIGELAGQGQQGGEEGRRAGLEVRAKVLSSLQPRTVALLAGIREACNFFHLYSRADFRDPSEEPCTTGRQSRAG